MEESSGPYHQESNRNVEGNGAGLMMNKEDSSDDLVCLDDEPDGNGKKEESDDLEIIEVKKRPNESEEEMV